MPAWSANSLTSVLNDHVAEVRFVSRESGNTRRMLCTNSKKLLNSLGGTTALHFRPPSGTLKYNPHAKGLVVTWDILWQDYRQISIDTANVLMVVPVKTDEEIDEFWRFFDRFLQNMDSWEKMRFMGK